MTTKPIPNFQPDMSRTVFANAHMAIRALQQTTEGTIDRPEAEEVVARRVPGAGPPQARAVLEREDIDIRVAPAEAFMS